MRTCLEEGAPVYLAPNNNPKRKLRYTLYAIKMPDGWVGVHTALANHLVAEAIDGGLFPTLCPKGPLKREVTITKGTRLDLFFQDPSHCDVFVEVKNTTLRLAEGLIGFPDARTTRGKKHLEELIKLKQSGKRAVMVFCIQREGITRMQPSWLDDPNYAETLAEAHLAGVEILAAAMSISKEEVILDRLVPVDLTRP